MRSYCFLRNVVDKLVIDTPPAVEQVPAADPEADKLDTSKVWSYVPNTTTTTTSSSSSSSKSSAADLVAPRKRLPGEDLPASSSLGY